MSPQNRFGSPGYCAKEFDYHACWSFPIEAKRGEIVGTFAMYYREPTDSSDLHLASTLTRTAAEIITRH
jgi:two-component system CheB/CheR fusion protein